MVALIVVYALMQPVQYVFAHKTNKARKAEDWPEFWRWWKPGAVLVVLQMIVCIEIVRRLSE